MMSSLASAGRVFAAPHNSYNVRFGFSSRISRGKWRGSGAHKRFWVRVNVKPVVFWASVRQLYISLSRQWTVISYMLYVIWSFTGTQGYCILPDSIYLHTIAHMPRLLCVCFCVRLLACVLECKCIWECMCMSLCLPRLSLSFSTKGNGSSHRTAGVGGHPQLLHSPTDVQSQKWNSSNIVFALTSHDWNRCISVCLDMLIYSIHRDKCTYIC